ncbi:MAG: amidohydrolase family protein, partial [Holophagales bacterium]|nr:amidohydrolase family protein [Holophagales bacterium]
MALYPPTPRRRISTPSARAFAPSIFHAPAVPRMAVFGAGLAMILSASLACAPAEPPAGSEARTVELVLTGGRIVTLDEARPEVEAVAVSNGRIHALGTAEEIAALVGDSTQVIELGGELVIPGFVESHAHFLGMGDALLQLPLNQAASWAEVVAMVAEAASEAEPGQWIRGRGWHQDKWTDTPPRVVDGFPTHDQLSEVAPENPVLLTHASGHALLANTKAMELAGIDGSTPDPDGGDIVRDAEGKATGLFNETAEGLIHAAREQDPATVVAETRKRIELASKECRTRGVTSFHDAGSSFDTIDLLRQSAADGELGVRLWMMAAGSNEELAEK